MNQFSLNIWIALCLLYLITIVQASHDLLMKAIIHGDLPTVNQLIETNLVDPSASENVAFQWACLYGRLPIVQRLREDDRVDPSADKNLAFRYAAKNGHLSVVNFLLNIKTVDPSDNDNEAIILAAESGHLSVVNRLLDDERVDPSAQENFAILVAYQGSHEEVVVKLLKDPRVYSTLSSTFRHQLASNPEPYLKAYTKALCVKDGISVDSFLCHLISIAANRNPSLMERILALWWTDILEKYHRSLGFQVRQLWRNGEFMEALEKIDNLWDTWKWSIRKRQAQFRYHPSRLSFQTDVPEKEMNEPSDHVEQS